MKRPRPTTGVRPSSGGRVSARLLTHQGTARDSLQRLLVNPLQSLMTVMVIGIALLLPSLLILSVSNLSQLGGDLQGTARISVYFHEQTSEEGARELSEHLLADERISSVTLMLPDQAADEFAHLSGLGDILSSLPENPLPTTLTIQPASTDPELLRALAQELAGHEPVDVVQLDLDWVQRLNSMLALGQRAAYGLIVILALAVLFIVGNTIRLAIANRRAEILVMKLVGATNGFVSRPFLYTGFWYGLLGGIAAWLLVLLLMALLSGPVDRLLALYDSTFVLHGPGLAGTAGLLGGSALLGWLGALVSVRQHLRDIEP